MRHFSSDKCANSLCGKEKQPVTWEVCCVDYWCGEARKHMSRGTGRRDMTELCLKNGIKLQSINQPLLFDQSEPNNADDSSGKHT